MKISVTVQFHNELEFLSNFFKSAEKYADEFLVGVHYATDGSLEFIREYASKSSIPVKIQEFPENTIHDHGFSYIKNHLIREATGDWIICLDADEEMEIDPDKSNLKRFTHGINVALTSHTLHTTHLEPHWSISDLDTIKKEAPWLHQRHWRIFKNGLGIQWLGILHEELRLPNGRHIGAYSRTSDVKMYHYGMMANPSKRSFKDGLYAELILRMVENPALRDGTNKFWWTEYYEKNKEQLTQQRTEYRFLKGIK